MHRRSVLIEDVRMIDVRKSKLLFSYFLEIGIG